MSNAVIETDVLNEHEAAKYARLSVHTLRSLRSNRTGGPRYVKLGRSVRYRRADLESWLSANTVSVEPETK